MMPHEHYLRALDLEEADRLGARAAYEACLAGDCSHLEARINLGRLLHLDGRHADAEALYRDTQEADATLFFNLAVLMEDLGRDAAAIKYYQEAIVHDPAFADAHFNLSMLQERRGETQSAYRHLLAYHRLIEAQKNPSQFSAREEED
jgi:tetratricopeptide (TPR) repeat protein